MTAPARLASQQLGTGPDVILVHGLAANRAFWYPLATALSRTCRVTLYDLRGHGYSERPASGYTVSDHAGDLLALVDELGIDRACVVGHSFGGGIALEAAIAAPSRFMRLALLDTRVNALQPEMRLHDVEFLSPFEASLLDRYRDIAEHETQIGVRFLEAAARLSLDDELPKTDNDFSPFGQGRGARRAARAWLDLMAQPGVPDAFSAPGSGAACIAGLTLPVLLLYAQHSRCAPSGLALRRLLPQAVFAEVAQAGHFFPLSHPAITLETVYKFIEAA